MTSLNGQVKAVHFQHSSPKNPCPVCGRTKDADCKVTPDNRVFCHSHQRVKIGDTLRGNDGQEWACIGHSTDGAGWGIFRVHQPLEKPDNWEKPARPKGIKFYEYLDRDGKPLVRVQRTDHGDGSKKFSQQRWDGQKWMPGLDGVDRKTISIYRYAEVQRAIRQGRKILWVEGEAAAESLWELGIPATTSIGGSGGFTKYGDYSQDLAGAEVILAPDRDEKGLKYADQVAQEFGATRWLYAGDTSAWENPNDGYDLADWIADLRSQKLDDAAIKAQILGAIGDRREPAMSSPPDVSGISTDEDQKEAFLETALKDLYSQGQYICLNQRDLYRWEKTHYELVADDRELSRITGYCRAKGKPSPSTIKAVLELQKLAVGITADEVNPPGYFNCANGLLRWWWDENTLHWELEPHDPDIIFIDPPAVAYDPAADATNLNRLLECLEPAAREILVKTLACSLDLPAIRKRKARTPRAVLLYGTGANGKDAIRTACFRLFGGRGCTAVGLTDFQSYDAGRKFPLADLEHSRVNWPSETVPAGKLDRIESLKLVTTGDPISIERKGIQEGRLTPQTVLLFNCNQPPKMTAATEAIKSRYAIIPFTKTYKTNPDAAKGELLADPRFKDDPQFIDREILPALLNLLLAKLQQVATEGINYDPVADQIDELRRRSSHLVQFCEDTGLVENPDGLVTVTELWQRLEAWYTAENYLTVETGGRGGKKRIWEHPPNDRCVTASNQVLARFSELFPKVRRKTLRDQTSDQDKVITYLHGISFQPPPDEQKKSDQQDDQEKNPDEFSENGSLGSLSNDKTAGNPVIESEKSRDSSQNAWVTGESLLPPSGSLLPAISDPNNPSSDSLIDWVTGEGHCSETPTNTGQNADNAVRSDPSDPKIQNPSEINGEDQQWTDF